MVFTRQRAFRSLARVTATLRLSSHARWQLGSTMSDLWLGATNNNVCPTHAAISDDASLCSIADGLFLDVFYFVCLYIPFISPVTICLCIAQILFEYLLVSC